MGGDGTGKDIVFYDDGRGMSEFGWICQLGTGLHLGRIVGESAGSMCSIPIQPCDRPQGQELAGERFDRLGVRSFRPATAIKARWRRCSVPRGRALLDLTLVVRSLKA